MSGLNFVLVVDALRPGNMSVYGYDLRTTPNLNEYLSRAIILENAYCCATNTDPSLTAIFTGRYPFRTGIRNHGARVTLEELPDSSQPEVLLRNPE